MFLKTNKLLFNKRVLLTFLPEFPSISLCSKYHHFFTSSSCFCPLQLSSKKHVNFNTQSSSSNVNLIKLNSPTGLSFQSYRYFNIMKNPLYKKAKSHTKHDDEDENDLLDEIVLDGPMGKGDKVLNLRLSSDRLDAVLKAGLNMSRNKIEKAFYADRIRINGIRPKKKSQLVSEKDEIDVIRKYNSKNPAYLDVSRIEILALEDGYSREDDEDEDDEAKKAAVLKRYKNLTIDNYKPPFKGNLDEEII